MKLDPFVSVDGVPFTISQEEIVKMRGQPIEAGRNSVGLNELDYASVVYRFQDSGRLEEVTMQATVVNFGNVAVPFDALPSFVQQQDPGVFERAGFVVSPRFGLAFDPCQPHWVTALAAHCLDAWRAL
ncbi:hypothetical protein H6CHR_02116 [Variovorax sp. PBL-H6]|uniref:hypothetical protein n=1 Tax=Variovorax sp. PBL-H6 TaxID=434009 RepID=UPI00131700B7|nr:hypothetical protein [Variovorax sp. PBL-H6]VTU24058.1 hypothetical protein H6CHR_02116 [Variovorax sp. PBL-H6]